MKPFRPPKGSSIVILTGAGISAESGIETFRGSGGLWENYKIEEVASIEGFQRDPGLVQSFYNARRAHLLLPQIKPNDAHFALAKLESEWNGNVLLITQNVDNLHERAGSRNLIHMHGELLKARCTRTDAVYAWTTDITRDTRCPCCGERHSLRPHIVWFGEIPFDLDIAFDALEECTLFAAIGTSGQVYPAAGFVHRVSSVAHTIELNAEPSSHSSRKSVFKEHRIGPATQTVPAWVDELLAASP